MDAVFRDPGGGFTVVDWKTGVRPTEPADERAAAVQLAAYRLAWARLRDVPVDDVRAALDESLALLGRQIAEDFAKFRLVQAADRVAQVDRVVVGQRLADTVHERVKDIALIIVDAGSDRGFTLGDFLHVALGQRHPL